MDESDRWHTLAARLVGVRENWQVHDWLNALPATVRPLDWVNVMLAALDGIGIAESTPALPDDLVAVCRDWGGMTDKALQPRFFRRCVEAAMRDRTRTLRRGPAGESRTTADIIAERKRDRSVVSS